MKYNWGHGIATVILIGIIGVTSLVWTVTKERIDMVTDEYYPKELNYQGQIDKIRSYKDLGQKIELQLDGELLVNFPQVAPDPKGISGSLHIYRPSDERLDIQKEIHLTEAYSMAIPKSLLKSGKYEVIIDWKANGDSYLTKLPLFIK